MWKMLLMHLKLKHQINPEGPNNQSQDKSEKINKPKINIGCTPEDWLFFMDQWSDYKVLSKPSDKDISRILLQCCETELRKNLHRIYGSLGSESEEFVLKAIKQQAVQIENIVVSRVNLLGMKQDHDETIRSYLARVKGQTRICNYSVKFKPKCDGCGKEKEYDVDYTDIQVCDVLVSSLSDNEIRTDILSEMDQDMPLNNLVQLIEAKEVGKKSATQLSNPHKISAVKSSYKRETKQAPHSKINYPKSDFKWDNSGKPQAKRCSWCGNYGHGNIREHETRKRKCPAFNHTCKICNVNNHFEKVCRRRNNSQLHKTSNSNINAYYSDSSSEPEDQVGAIRQHPTYQQD